MSYTRDILILANSRHFGHCIAGKDVNTGEWVRVKKRKGSFSDKDLDWYFNYEESLRLGDVVRIQFTKKDPKPHHPEDEIIDERHKWKLIDQLSRGSLYKFVDKDSGSLLAETEYIMDHIKPSFFDKRELKSSLQYLKMTKTQNKPVLHYERKFNSLEYRPSLKFNYRGKEYNLKITDYNIPTDCEKKPDRSIGTTYITVGLGGLYEATRSHYKLVVGMMCP